jgi:hypothetical protein
MGDLWNVIKEANAALPLELQLEMAATTSLPASAENVNFQEWLRAPNGAALGYAGSGIRYLWPETSQRRSNNFWVHWDSQRQRYVLTQRTSNTIPPSVAEYRFDETRVGYMLKCLVLGKRITTRSVRKKRLWLL